MNYLAHLLLAGKSPDSRIGNLLGDFVKGSLESYQSIYNPEIVRGIQLHRKVDTFTDSHPIYITSKRRISLAYKGLSGIIIDIAYDHFLCKNWKVFCEEELEKFISEIYQLLEEKQQILPEKLQQLLPHLISEDWLNAYKTLAGVSVTFGRISKRLKRQNHLTTALEEVVKNYCEIEADFLVFFPELIDYVAKICENQH